MSLNKETIGEMEKDMQDKYPHFFDDLGTILL